ncbi:MAG: 3-oxoacyl-ACP synthase [Cyclobacteriaceae bacterium]
MTLTEERDSLLAECRRIVDDRIAKAQAELKSFSEQSGEETKSSAGDKYETARAMLHLEKEKTAAQLSESIKLKKVLDQIGHGSGNTGLGKLLATNQGKFFISVSLGMVSSNEEKYFVLSPVAPLGKIFTQAKQGQEVEFNGKKYEVLEVLT